MHLTMADKHSPHKAINSLGQKTKLSNTSKSASNGSALHQGLIPLLPDQFAYVLDHPQNKVVEARGFKDVLGYADNAIDIRLLRSIIHPDDLPVVTGIVERACQVLFAIEPVLRPFETVLSIDFRVQKANGHYMKVVRQVTVFELDAKHDRVHRTLSVCKDISSIRSNDPITWQCTGRGAELLDMTELLHVHRELIYRPTTREMDIIRKMAEGKSSTEIAAELFIRTHTVNNHRRNLLRRTGAKNSAELVRRITELAWL